MVRLAAALCVFLVAGGAANAAGVSGGHYVSLDGSMEHNFSPSGDYMGKSTVMDTVANGVFREGPGSCWLNMDDGSKKMGDILVYVAEAQCCLSSEIIADKTVMSVIWVQGTGPGYVMCKNQVFRLEK